MRTRFLAVPLLAAWFAAPAAAQTVAEYNAMLPTQQDAAVSALVKGFVSEADLHASQASSPNDKEDAREFANLAHALFSAEPGPPRPPKDADGYATLRFPVGFTCDRGMANQHSGDTLLAVVVGQYLGQYSAKYSGNGEIRSKSDADQQAYFQAAYRRDYETELRKFKDEWAKYEDSWAKYERDYAEFTKDMQRWKDAIAKAQQELDSQVSLAQFERASDAEKSRLMTQIYLTGVAHTEKALRSPAFSDGRPKTPDRIARDKDRAEKVDDLARAMSSSQWKDLRAMIDQYAQQQADTMVEAVVVNYLLRTIATVPQKH